MRVVREGYKQSRIMHGAHPNYVEIGGGTKVKCFLWRGAVRSSADRAKGRGHAFVPTPSVLALLYSCT